MKANELMVGDIILYEYDKKRFPARVEEIYLDSALVEEVNGEFEPIEIEENELFPIPLTPEILEKNGFDVSDPEVSIYRFEEDGQAFRFCLRRMYDKDNHPNGYSFYAFNVLAIIDSVHQLQHALRLCGIEKEIEI